MVDYDKERAEAMLGYDRFERRFYAGKEHPFCEEEWRRADPLVALVQAAWDAVVAHQLATAK